MRQTDRLRELLDERGVGYDGDNRSVVYFKDSRGYKAMAYEAPRRYGNGVLCVHHTATPEQAVEAALGRGTCRNIAPTYLDFLCSECGFVHYHSDANDTGDGNEWRFCPSCGRRAVG